MNSGDRVWRFVIFEALKSAPQKIVFLCGKGPIFVPNVRKSAFTVDIRVSVGTLVRGFRDFQCSRVDRDFWSAKFNKVKVGDCFFFSEK